MSRDARSVAGHSSIGIILRLTRVSCLLLLMAATLAYFPNAKAELPVDSMSNVDVVGGWSAYPVAFDGKITDGREWSDAYQQSIVLFRGWFDNERPPLRSNDTVTATFYAKNDAKWLYLLAHVNSTSRDPLGVGIDYFWWRYHGVWDGARGAGVTKDSSTYDWYYVNETYRQFVKPSNVKGAASCRTFLVSGSDCWFELAKMLRSDDPHDWSLAPGDVLGTRPPDLMYVVYFSKPNGDRDYYLRYVTLHLSTQTESAVTTRVTSTFAWHPEPNESFTWTTFLMSPDIVLRVDPGTYEIGKIEIQASLRKSLTPSGTADWFGFDVGATLGSTPESFRLNCDQYGCAPSSSNSYYGLSLSLAPDALGSQDVELEMAPQQMQFSVRSSNQSGSPTLITHSDPLSYDSEFATSGTLYVNLLFWSGDNSRERERLILDNATISVELVGEPLLIASLPKPRLSLGWTRTIARNGLATTIAGLAASDDGHVLAALNAHNDTDSLAEIYLLDPQGNLVWSRTYPHSTFYWNLVNIALSPDNRFAAYAIYSSDNASVAGIWYVDENGQPIWVHNVRGYHSVAMSSDGQLVVAVGATSGSGKGTQVDPKMLVFDGRGLVLWQPEFKGELPFKVSVSPEGDLIAVTTGIARDIFGGFNSSVYLFDKSGRVLWRHFDSSIPIYAVARSVDVSSLGDRIVVSYRDGTVVMLDRSGTVVGRYLHSFSATPNGWPPLAGDTFNAVITNDGQQIVTSQGFSLFVFTGDLAWLMAVPWGPYDVLNVATSSWGNYIAAGTYEGVLYFYVLSAEKSVQYAMSASEAAKAAGVIVADSTLDAMILAQSQGRWLDAYVESQRLVNETVAALQNQYSLSYAQAQTDLSEIGKKFNETSSLLTRSKSSLNSTQTGEASIKLSEASGLLSIAESYLAKAPEEFRSGNYVVALKFVQRATQAIEEARAQMNDLNMQINGSPSISALNSYLVPMAVVVLVALALPTIWLIRRRGRAPKK